MQFSTYLAFNGTCEEAMTFYCAALGAEMKIPFSRYKDAPMPYAPEDAESILHCGIEKDGYLIMASDGNVNQGVTYGNNAHISINFSSEDEINRVYAALSEGGQKTMDLQDTFWGARFGMCVDKFGNSWMFNWDRPGVNPEHV